MKQLGVGRGLILIETFVALTSIICGLGMAAVGVIQFPLAFLRGTPFSDHFIPGLIMAIAVGGSALLAAVLLLADRPSGILASACAGVILLSFEVVEVLGIDRNTGNLLPLVLALQTAYTLFGLVMLGGAAFLWRQQPPRAVNNRWLASG